MTVFAARTTTRKSGLGNPPFAANAFWRLLVLVAMFGLFIMLLIGRLATLALFESTRAFGATATDYVPDRGDIVDRNGVPLARSIYGYAIWVKPQDILGNKKELAAQLSTIFPDTLASEFYAKLTAGKSGYLRKRALPEQVRQVHDLGEIAIEFPREATRLYPQHDMAAHVLGFVNRDGKGALGMERVMNDHLRDPAKRGKPLNLALDIRVQAALEIELASGMTATGAKGAAGVILDVQTGEVVAMATLPSFNPNRPVFANIPDLGQTIIDGRYPIARQTNNVTNRVYELGSTFKPLTVAAALDAGTVRDLSIRYDATAPLAMPITTWVTPSPVVLLCLLALALLCSAVAYLLYYRLIADIGPTKAISVTFLIPFFGVAWGVVFLGERLTSGAMAGGLLVLLGMTLVLDLLPTRRRDR